MPHERDADASATAYRKRLGVVPTADELAGPDRMLFDAPWSAAARSTLPARQLALSVLLAPEFAEACSLPPSPQTVDDLLDSLLPGGAALRRRAIDTGGFVDVISALKRGSPEAEFNALDAADRRPWLDERRWRLVGAEQSVIDSLGM